MKNYLLKFIFFLFLPSLSMAQSYSSPESVEYDAAHNRWLVSSTNNGKIIARSATGVLSNFVSVLGPYGIEIMNDTVYVVNGTHVTGYSLANGAMGTDIDIPASAFLNGIASDGTDNLYVTDFSGYKIYRVNISGQYYTQYVNLGAAPSPNGIIMDPPNNRLVFVSWGSNAPVRAISLSDSTVSTVATTTYSNCDGIARDGSGNFYISAWGTQSIYKFNNTFSASGTAVVTTNLTSPADIYYAVSLDTLGIPCATTTGVNGNKVRFIGFVTAAPTIATTSVTGSTFCKGDALDVNFTVSTDFSAGNSFGAVLSDSLGSFASPLTIGSLAATTSGTIHCTIPTSSSGGTGFRVKVIGSAPVYTGPDNGSNVTINTCTGISETSADQLVISPNPSKGKFTISGINGIVTGTEVFNALGDKILDMSGDKGKCSVLDLTNQPGGIYFLKIKLSDGKSLDQKLIKE